MKSRQTRVLEALRVTQGFLDDNTALLDGVNRSGARRTLDAVVTQLTAHAVTQDLGTRLSRGETANQRALRMILRFNHMKPIADVARMRLREVPNFIALTRPRNNVSATRLIAAAGAMADAATPYEDVFIDAGLDPDFLTQLRQAAENMRRSLDDRAQSRRQSAGATEGLRVEEQRGTAILRLLDGLVIPKLGTNDQLLAQWKSARKIHAKPGPLAGSSGAALGLATDASRSASALNSTSTTHQASSTKGPAEAALTGSAALLSRFMPLEGTPAFRSAPGRLPRDGERTP